jgi:hypothetical protein
VSAIEIENAVRQLPPQEARELLTRLRTVIEPAGPGEGLTDEVIEKWQVRSGFPAGLTTAEYLKLIRDGDRD